MSDLHDCILFSKEKTSIQFRNFMFGLHHTILHQLLNGVFVLLEE